VVEAKDKTALINGLRRHSLILISVQELKEHEANMLRSKSKVKMEDLVLFSRQFATLIKAGVPIMKGLSILFSQVEDRYLKEIVSGISTSIESGLSLSDALAKHPEVFGTLYINMIKAGESSGALDTVFDRLSQYLEETNKLMHKIKSAFAYPVVVIIVATLLTSLIFLKVIPGFKEIFSSMGSQLPLPTQIAIRISEILRQYFFIIVGTIIGLFFFIKQALRYERVIMEVDKTQLKVPVFGKIIRKYIIARFTRTLSTLLKSGVSILSALDISSKTVGNKVIETNLLAVKNQVSKGEKIGVSLSQSQNFPPLVVNLIAIGEETGDLPSMLEKIAVFYEDEVNISTAALTSLIEPFIIVFLGTIIGGIVIAMFLPILQMSRLITH
jgi:type IV pilus assembly protein PilC